MIPFDENAVELEEDALEDVAGGNDYGANGNTDGNGGTIVKQRTVINLKSGYLAVRSKAKYDDNNIIGHLYLGHVVSSYEEYKTSDHLYVRVYVNCPEDTVYKCKAYTGDGWVNAGFLS